MSATWFSKHLSGMFGYFLSRDLPAARKSNHMREREREREMRERERERERERDTGKGRRYPVTNDSSLVFHRQMERCEWRLFAGITRMLSFNFNERFSRAKEKGSQRQRITEA